MHTTASLHVHPAAASIDLIFKIRRLAKQYGCAFGTTKRSTASLSKGGAQSSPPAAAQRLPITEGTRREPPHPSHL